MRKPTEITVKITDSGQRSEPVTFQFGSRGAISLARRVQVTGFQRFIYPHEDGNEGRKNE